jgi:cell division septum initiation protein DivIVA
MSEQLIALVRRLEEIVDDATRVPLTDKVIISEDDLYDIVDALRESLPKEVAEAVEIVRQKERILEEARAKAEETMRQASGYVEKLASESNIARRAEEQADAIIREARRVAQEIHRGSREYADELLEKAEQILSTSLMEVQKGREELRSTAPKVNKADPAYEEKNQG